MGVAMNTAKYDASCNREDAVLGTHGVAFSIGGAGKVLRAPKMMPDDKGT